MQLLKFQFSTLIQIIRETLLTRPKDETEDDEGGNSDENE